MNENAELIYQNFLSEYGEEAVGTPEQFYESLKDPNNRKAIFDSFGGEEGVGGSLPDFEKSLGFEIELPAEEEPAEEKSWLGKRYDAAVNSMNKLGLATVKMLQTIPEAADLVQEMVVAIPAHLEKRKIEKAVKAGDISPEEGAEQTKLLMQTVYTAIEEPSPAEFTYSPGRTALRYFEDALEQKEDKIESRIKRKEESITQLISEGRIWEAMDETSGAISESAPLMIAALLGGPVGLGVVGVNVAASKAEDLREEATEALITNEDISPIDLSIGTQLVNAFGDAAAEVVFETVTAKLGKPLRQMIAGGKKKQATDILSRAVDATLTPFLKKYGVKGAMFAEGISEVGTTIAQNAVAKYTGEDPDRELTDGVGDSFIVGAAMGGGLGGITKVAAKTVGANQLSKAIRSGDQKAFDQLIDTSVETGEIKQEDADFLKRNYAEAVSVVNSIPASKRSKQTFHLVRDKKRLIDKIKQKQTELNQLDPVFQEEAQAEIDELENQKTQIDEQLKNAGTVQSEGTEQDTEETVQGVPVQPTVGEEAITDEEFNTFVDTGNVTPERLSTIAEKVKTQQPLSQRETAIFTAKTGEVNELIKGTATPTGDIFQELDIKPLSEQEVAEQTPQRESPTFFEGLAQAAPATKFESPEQINEVLAGNYALLTSENPNGTILNEADNAKLHAEAVKWLTDKGLTPIPIVGRFGAAENSFLVPDMTRDQAVEFANRFKQMGIAMKDEIVNPDGTSFPATQSPVATPGADFTQDAQSVIKLADGTFATIKGVYDFGTGQETAPAEEVVTPPPAPPVQTLNTKVKHADIQVGDVVRYGGIDYEVTRKTPKGMDLKGKDDIQFRVKDARVGDEEFQGRVETQQAPESTISEPAVETTPEPTVVPEAPKVLLAPNGKPSNLTPEQWNLVRTPAFKNWFGDWEGDPANASKVVDENGEPLVVYHGSQERGLQVLDPNRAVEVEGAVFFTNREDVASEYLYPREHNEVLSGEYVDIYDDDGEIVDTEFVPAEGGDMIEGFLNIRNPISTPAAGGFLDLGPIVKEGKRKGNDGVIVRNIDDSVSGGLVGTTYAIFNSNQVKLADGTNTTFDPNSNSLSDKTTEPTLDVVTESPTEVAQAAAEQIEKDLSVRHLDETVRVDPIRADNETMKQIRDSLITRESVNESTAKTIDEIIKEAINDHIDVDGTPTKLNDLVSKAHKSGYAVSDSELVAIGYAILKKQEVRENQRQILEKAIASNDPQQGLYYQHLDATEAQLEELVDIVNKAGTFAGRALRIRQELLSFKRYTELGLTEKMKKATPQGKTLNAEDKKFAETQAKAIAKKEKEIADLEKVRKKKGSESRKAVAEAEVENIKAKKADKRTTPKQLRESKNLEAARQQLRDVLNGKIC